jgi:hypothetical protein
MAGGADMGYLQNGGCREYIGTRPKPIHHTSSSAAMDLSFPERSAVRRWLSTSNSFCLVGEHSEFILHFVGIVGEGFQVLALNGN